MPSDDYQSQCLARSRFDWSKADWTQSDGRVAKALGCTKMSAVKARRRLGMPKSIKVPRPSNITKDNLKSFVSITERGCWEWKYATCHGYGEFRHKRVHRIAYEMFVGEIPAGMIVRHKCDNPPCCNPDHLLLGTHLDNATDRVTRGRGYCGERHGLSILSSSDVIQIRKMYAAGQTVSQISQCFPQVSFTGVYCAAKGKSWKHLPPASSFEPATAA